MAKAIRQCDEDATGQDAFRIRMEAQCFQVERYRLAVVREEGRQLSLDEAALEWISRFAEAYALENDSV